MSDDNCYYEINICLDWTGVRPCTLHTTVPRTKARCSVEREIHGVSVCTAYVFRRTPMPRYAGIRCRLGDTRTPRRRSVSA